MSQNSQMIERLAGVLHTLSCTKPHAQRMEELLKERDPSICYFYLEETIFSEERPSHKEWEERAKQLCANYQMSPDEILRMLPTLLECRQKLVPFLQKAPTAVELCRLILFSELGTGA